ncbi:MAG: hypothetical protein Q9195_006682 [Heterodermia aff. obscurata]
MRIATQTALASLFFSHLATSAYTPLDTYNSTNFFSAFTFFTAPDPTNGAVTYVDLPTAATSTLIATAPLASNAIYLSLDSTTPSTPKRNSVRLNSLKTYNTGLFILDLAHMPTGCGVWPAFWLLGTGATWPTNGEIDIIEGVNNQGNNSMTLHTTSGCRIQSEGFTGHLDTPDCDVNNATQGKNMGCGIRNPSPASFGAGFNAQGGGVVATEVTAQAISIWFWNRGQVPADVMGEGPDPAKWGTPVARYAGGCNISERFKNMQIVFDTTLCGDWAGETWAKGECAARAPTCEAFVRDNAGGLGEAYWLVNGVRVFEEGKVGRRGRRGV